jgi:hypothetical protein
LLPRLPLAQPGAKILIGDAPGRVLETPVQIDPSLDLVGLHGWDIIGFQSPLGEDGELKLHMKMLSVRTAALGLAAGSSTLNERTREHFS